MLGYNNDHNAVQLSSCLLCYTSNIPILLLFLPSIPGFPCRDVTTENIRKLKNHFYRRGQDDRREEKKKEKNHRRHYNHQDEKEEK